MVKALLSQVPFFFIRVWTCEAQLHPRGITGRGWNPSDITQMALGESISPPACTYVTVGLMAPNGSSGNQDAIQDGISHLPWKWGEISFIY